MSENFYEATAEELIKILVTKIENKEINANDIVKYSLKLNDTPNINPENVTPKTTRKSIFEQNTDLLIRATKGVPTAKAEPLEVKTIEVEPTDVGYITRKNSLYKK